MLSKLLTKIVGNKHQREWKRAQPTIRRINELCDTLDSLTDEELAAKTPEFRQRLVDGASVDDLMEEAFAVVKQVCKRAIGHEYEVAGQAETWNMIPYDVQIFGGIMLHRGRIAEMATGEGKTLVAIAPVYLNALTGGGVHLVTVNDYLARRDADWMGPIYARLGLSVGCIQNDLDSDQRRVEYAYDVTYGTNNEFGFDYLRDNMAIRSEDQVQRGFHFAIVDEVDSVLIDEARTPLIISGPVSASDRDRYFVELKPTVEQLVRRQRELCNGFVQEAAAKINDGDNDERYDAARLLLLVERGMPKNKRLLRLYKESGVQKAIRRVEADYMREKQLHVLDEELFFAIDEKQHTVGLSDKGIATLSEKDRELFLLPDVAELIGAVDDRADLDAAAKLDEKERIEHEAALNSAKVHCINQLLRAYSLYERDVEYVVQGGKVMIVDTFTGRLMPGRRWSDGLHQAVEAKEGVRVEGENQTLATITLQNYFRMYEKLAGMTGTAETEASEFYEIYKLDVQVIPTNVPVVREDMHDQIYRTRREKYNAVVNEIAALHAKGQPLLIGTVSVDVSETLSRMLRRRKVPHNVLNAKFHAQEAEIVRGAGQRGAVTIATNMAGRGTDIKLGEGVVELGGLFIMGTERHEARRIDRQLRGRSGRQGDPGASRFYLSLEDDLMRLFGSERIANIMDRLGVEEGEVIEHPMVTRSIERAQRKVEERNFEMRKRLLEYDDVMNRQREVVYDRRAQALRGDDLRGEMLHMLDEEAEAIVDQHVDPKLHPEQWGWDAMQAELARVFLVKPEFPMREDPRVKREAVLEHARAFTLKAYEEREELFTPGLMRQIERMIYLQTVDRLWKDHLYEMDQLKSGIGLRGYGQRDPLLEYKKEGFEMFVRMLGQLNREVLSVLFRVRLDATPEAPAPVAPAQAMQARHDAAPGLVGGGGGNAIAGGGRPGAPPPPAARPPRAAAPGRASGSAGGARTGRPPAAARPGAARPQTRKNIAASRDGDGGAEPRDTAPTKEKGHSGLGRPKRSGPKARKKKQG
jgi:preprotein translocase subunit SecA